MRLKILTDSNCDLPLEYIRENNIPCMNMIFNYKGQEYRDDLGVTIPYKEFYDGIRDGDMPTTSQVNAYLFKEYFNHYLNEGYSIIYIGFSSALSGTFHQATIATEEILEDNPHADITLIDSKSISSGQGLLVHYANELLKQGMGKDYIVTWLKDNVLKVNNLAAVDSLHHLKRGGRISGTSATMGTLLGIKPLLNINAEGKLVPFSKVKGRKKSLKTLANLVSENIVNPEEQVIFINHGDCEEDSILLKNMITENIQVKDIVVNYMGYSIGAHAGPGAIAVFFIGKHRS